MAFAAAAISAAAKGLPHEAEVRRTKRLKRNECEPLISVGGGHVRIIAGESIAVSPTVFRRAAKMESVEHIKSETIRVTGVDLHATMHKLGQGDYFKFAVAFFKGQRGSVMEGGNDDAGADADDDDDDRRKQRRRRKRECRDVHK